MAPTLIDDRDGLVLVLGTPGGDSIPSTLLQLISNLVDLGMPLDQAIDAPRLHRGIPGGALRLEGSRPIPTRARAQLKRMGHRFKKERSALGHANSILLRKGLFCGAVDPREGGLAQAIP